MSKKFTTKEKRNRGKSKRRAQSLRVDPPRLVRKPTLEEQNHEVIAKLAAGLKD